MRVVGTAGHVDHGKSTLIAALTGTHPDRLKEERAREMTIDLGFASLTLPGGETIGIVDVPGHRDFIENMLAGVGGIDAALFVVAADEGVMPQTREHLAILDLLQVPGGVIVLTKIDLIEDEEWVDLVELDVKQIVQGTVFAQAPIVRISARTGAGLGELLDRLSEVLAQSEPRADLGRARLPVDRVFIMPGFGTVVTGTLTDGHFQVGEEVEILPSGIHGRIRGLQTHNRKVETAVPGSRTAINIAGVNVDQIARGAVIAQPGRYQSARWLDVQFRLLPDAAGALKHSSEVKLFLGTAEVLARVRLLGVDVLEPGQEGGLQLELREPVVAQRGDRYILRRPSPGETLGGGMVLDPRPQERHKRFSPAVLASLQALRAGSPEDVLLEASAALGPAPLREIVQRARLDSEVASQALTALIAAGSLLLLEGGNGSPDADGLALAHHQWERLAVKALELIEAYHHSFPLRRGMPREEFKSRMKLTTRVSNAIVRTLVQAQQVVEMGVILSRPDFQVRFTPAQQERVQICLDQFASSPFAPPTIQVLQSEVGEDVYNALVEAGQLTPVSSEVVFRSVDYLQMAEGVRRHIEQNGSITLAQFRDRFGTTRKYAQAFLEHLDQAGVTVREGDARKLRTAHKET
ncbi:MAG: selenocysteine-specific translation elongation factor [Anaerolineaceae bacterium]|nr:selenocysteine-specific translation elongation factor [Anaerolineaceae bacterium]